MESNLWFILASSALLLVGELVYFRIAARFNIIDKPNERSSHTIPIIRGGGVIFVLALLIWFFQSNFRWPLFAFGVCIIAVVSFLDDIAPRRAGVRFFFHLAAVIFVFSQLWPLPWPAYLLVLAVIICIGTINTFNFMDGVNGITGVYSLVMLITFSCIEKMYVNFTSSDLLLLLSISVLIFLYFNFRRSARCFAGDVGSVSMALILIFVLLQLIRTTGNFLWPLLLLVYGTDSIVTIIYRLRRRENIFKAHRTHLYQYLTNELGYSHQAVSIWYGIVQAIINIAVFAGLTRSNSLLPLSVSGIFIIIYLIVRDSVTKRIQKPIA